MKSINLYIVVLLGLLLASGCSDPEEEFLRQEPAVTRATILARNLALQQAGERDYRQSYVSSLYRSFGVGYGYCAFNGYADYASVRDILINLDSLEYYQQQEQCHCIIDDRSPRAYQQVMTGEDSEKLLRSLSANAGLSADLAFFQGEVKGSYASSDLKSNYYSFCTIHTGIILGSRHTDPITLVELCRRHPGILAPGLRQIMAEIEEAMEGMTPNLTLATQLTELLYEIYGTHLLYHADLGGRLTYLSTFERAALDSKSDLSVSARASLLGTLNYEVSEKEKYSLQQSATNSKNRMTAIGGDVTIISQMLFSNTLSEEQSAIGAGLTEQWYKSVRLNFDSITRNNAELIEIKLYPLDEFIAALGNESVSALLRQKIGRQSAYEDGMFPRVYGRSYVQFPTQALWQISNSRIHTLSNEDEIYGELDYERIRQREFITCYPTIEGTLCHEGIARGYGTDSLYVITWHDTVPYITPLCLTADVPYLYYTGGDLDIVPVQEQSYSAQYTLAPLETHMWTTSSFAAAKFGPYTLIQGSYATTGDKTYSNFSTVITDLPAGCEELFIEDMERLLPFVRRHYNVCPAFFQGKNLLLRSREDPKPKVYRVSNDMKLQLDSQGTYGFVICRRKEGFRYP